MSSTTIRMDDDLRRALDKRLDAVGLTLNGYVNLAARQFVIQNRIPFEIVTPEAIPNEVTRKAMLAAEAKELGLIPDDSKTFNSVDDAMDYLNQED
jgi:DNA-damage-inducible protein J